MHVRTCGNEEIRAPRPKGAAKRAASWRRPRNLAGCKRGVASRGPHRGATGCVFQRRSCSPHARFHLRFVHLRATRPTKPDPRRRRAPTTETPETRTRDARVESATDSTLERPARSPRSPRPGTRGRPARRRTHGPAARSVNVFKISRPGIMSIWTHTAMTPQTANSHAPEGWCRGFIYSSTAAPYSTCNNSHPLRGSL